MKLYKSNAWEAFTGAPAMFEEATDAEVLAQSRAEVERLRATLEAMAVLLCARCPGQHVRDVTPCGLECPVAAYRADQRQDGEGEIR